MCICVGGDMLQTPGLILCSRRQQSWEERQFSRAEPWAGRCSCSLHRGAGGLSSWALQPHTACGGEPGRSSRPPLQPPRTPFWGGEASWRRDRGTLSDSQIIWRCCFKCRGYVVSYEINLEWWLYKDLEGSGLSLLQCTVPPSLCKLRRQPNEF